MDTVCLFYLPATFGFLPFFLIKENILFLQWNLFISCYSYCQIFYKGPVHEIDFLCVVSYDS